MSDHQAFRDPGRGPRGGRGSGRGRATGRGDAPPGSGAGYGGRSSRSGSNSSSSHGFAQPGRGGGFPGGRSYGPPAPQGRGAGGSSQQQQQPQHGGNRRWEAPPNVGPPPQPPVTEPAAQHAPDWGHLLPGATCTVVTSAAAAPPSASSTTDALPDVSSLSVHDEKQPVPSSGQLQTFVSPKRPTPGRAGRRALVRANHFLVKLKSGIVIFQYDVDINPKVTSKALCRRLYRELMSTYDALFGERRPVYDGSKSLWCAGALPFENKEFTLLLVDESREKEFTVSIRRVAMLNSSAVVNFLQGKGSCPQEHLQALDIALREAPTHRFTPVGRSFFTKDFGSALLDGGLVAWNGFFQSLRPTAQGLVINVDLATTSFYESIALVEFLRKNLRQFDPRSRMSDATRSMVKKAIVRLKVSVIHRQTPRKYRICGLSPVATKDLRFTLDEGVEVGIMEYFWNTYNFRIMFPELPCVQVQAKKTSYLPMEVCVICEGQKYIGRLSERQTTSLRALACVRPGDREQNIRSLMARPDGPGRGEFVSAFGMEVSAELTTVNARILNPPKLKYGSNGAIQEIEPRFGAWNLMSSCMVEGGKITYWAMVCFDNAINFAAANAFANGLARRCMELGMSLAQQMVMPPALCRRDDLDGPKLDRTLRNVFAQATQATRAADPRASLELLVCVMGDRHASYGDLKRICETDLGVITQCCLTKHVRQLKSQYLANLALKINAKAGGRNNTLAVEIPQLCPMFSRPAMVMGADVTHPNPGDDASPSIAAVVASNDWPSAIRYVASVRAQAHREEVIQGLKEMAQELWRRFCDRTRLRPEQIIMFRDGVSEGQFEAVLQSEVRALKEAFAQVGGPEYNPRITWVVLQKRHHTRLFPADNNRDKSNNVVPGTVVDTTITHPTEFDFYLCSHAGIQGSSKPTHYHVLWDENGFTSDSLQSLINNLCYTYVRCTRSVSIVPPAYYAHLAAYRARLYIEGQGGSSSDSSSQRGGELSSRSGTSSGGRTSRPGPSPVRPLPAIRKNVQDVMYFC